MKVTERQLRRIIKETLHHVAAAAAAGSARGGGGRRRSSKMNTEPDTSSLRSGSDSGSSVGTPQDLSGGKAKQMYADLKIGISSKFFDIVDDIDMYTRARQVDVIMLRGVDENEIATEMKMYNRDNQKGGFTEENYEEWVDNDCPILKHDMHFYRKFKEVWKGLSLMPESKLRQIIRSIIKENARLTETAEAEEELERMNIYTLEDYLNADASMLENRYALDLKQKFHEKMAEFERKYNSLSESDKGEVDMLAEEIRIKKSLIAVSNAKKISKIMFGTLWAFPLIIAVLCALGIISAPAFIAGASWAGPAVVGSFIGGLFQYGLGDIEDHDQAITNAQDDLSRLEKSFKYRS